MAMTTATGTERGRSPVGEEPEGCRLNVGDTERWLSLAGGAALAALGLSRRSLAGLGLAAVGGALAYRGWSGHCPLYRSLGVNTARHGEHAPTSVPAGQGVKVQKT